MQLLDIESIYKVDQQNEADKVFKTDDMEHPGVRSCSIVLYLYRRTNSSVEPPEAEKFEEFYFDPVGTRRIFRRKRLENRRWLPNPNPVHRAHEYIQKSAMEIVDGAVP